MPRNPTPSKPVPLNINQRVSLEVQQIMKPFYPSITALFFSMPELLGSITVLGDTRKGLLPVAPGSRYSVLDVFGYGTFPVWWDTVEPLWLKAQKPTILYINN